MKTLGRIFIILAATALVTGALYLTFNSTSMNLPSEFAERGERFQPSGSSLDFETGARPEFYGERFERGEGMEGGFLPFGWIKNIGVMGVIVAIFVLPKGLKKKKRLAQLSTDSNS